MARKECGVSSASASNHSALLLLRTHADMAALAHWAAATGQRDLRQDIGYALHAALRATLGELAPRPFALLRRPGSVQMIGYTRQPQSELAAAIDAATLTDPNAAKALGLDRPACVTVKSMPDQWRVGQHLSFEVRVAPVVRSRSQPGGGYPEIDAAFHPDFAGEAPGDRAAAYARWLARELAREGAAKLLSHRTVAFSLTPMARRAARTGAGNTPARAARQGHQGLLPDLTVRGQLSVQDPAAFNALLARGLGRHRSFGFGCLLLAPPGAWS